MRRDDELLRLVAVGLQAEVVVATDLESDERGAAVQEAAVALVHADVLGVAVDPDAAICACAGGDEHDRQERGRSTLPETTGQRTLAPHDVQKFVVPARAPHD